MGFIGTEQRPFASPHPTRDAELRAAYPRMRDGTLPMAPEECLKRAQIAQEYGFCVDPITGRAFWGIPQFDPLKR